jgi:hypothetical protein
MQHPLNESAERLRRDVRCLSNWIDALMVQTDKAPGLYYKDVIQAITNNIDSNMKAVKAETDNLGSRIALHMRAFHPEA